MLSAAAAAPAAGADARGANYFGVDYADPFRTRDLAPPPRLPGFAEFTSDGDLAPCRFAAQPLQQALTLADVIDRALCNNPQTRLAWANARVQAAQAGVARSAFLPSLSASVTANRSQSSNAAANAEIDQLGAGLSASWVLLDFGARDAALEGALQSLAASRHTQDATLQKLFLLAVQAYYNLFANRAAVDSALEAERRAQESLKAAAARYEAGSGTPADRLQAQTAYSQAVLNRIQAEGTVKSAEGALANTMGEDAHRALAIAAPALNMPDAKFEQDLGQLIAAARKRRPDLAAAEAQLKAAQANVDAARAAGMPTLSLSTSMNVADSDIANPVRSQALGITLSIPIFAGFGTTYRVQAAQAQVASQAAQRDSLSQQVALDVWQAYYALTTGTQAVRSSADLVASAMESERVALGRYRAGVGNIIDVLTAQSSLASARLQNIQATYSWQVARTALAQTMGQLDLSAVDALR